MVKQKSEYIDTNNEFFIRDKDNIDDFLYEEASSYIRKDCASRFDQLDLIFIQGDANLRPWSQSASKIMVFLRMCLQTQKQVFASSFGMQALVFLAATNIERQINIINGNDGGKITEIKKIKFLSELKHSDYFLDNTTGDLYQYNYECGEWQPKANSGLHQRKAAQSYQSIGKYILKAPTYRPKIYQADQTPYKNINTETICHIKKNYIHHFVKQDIISQVIGILRSALQVSSTYAQLMGCPYLQFYKSRQSNPLLLILPLYSNFSIQLRVTPVFQQQNSKLSLPHSSKSTRNTRTRYKSQRTTSIIYSTSLKISSQAGT